MFKIPGPFQYKIRFNIYGDFHYIDKKVMLYL